MPIDAQLIGRMILARWLGYSPDRCERLADAVTSSPIYRQMSARIEVAQLPNLLSTNEGRNDSPFYAVARLVPPEGHKALRYTIAYRHPAWGREFHVDGRAPTTGDAAHPGSPRPYPPPLGRRRPAPLPGRRPGQWRTIWNHCSRFLIIPGSIMPGPIIQPSCAGTAVARIVPSQPGAEGRRVTTDPFLPGWTRHQSRQLGLVLTFSRASHYCPPDDRTSRQCGGPSVYSSVSIPLLASMSSSAVSRAYRSQE